MSTKLTAIENEKRFNSQTIARIEATLADSPENYQLRIHLAELLLQADRPEDALREAATVLQDEPDHADALRIAVRAARAAGKPDRAERYLRLLTALGHEMGTETTPEDASEEEDDEQEEQPHRVLPLRVVQGGIADESWRVERADVKLADVGGLESVKRRLDLSIFALLRNAEMRKYYGQSIRGGLLLYGPPGCGKTFVARATAGEMGARFLPVGLSDVLDSYTGETERKLHTMFETARRNAPCVLFIDEIDAMGRRRSLQRAGAERNLVNQLLTEMDSVGANNDGVFILGATNHLWDVDTALRRPGRFDRVIFVAPPDREARRAILAFNMRERTAEGIDLAAVGAMTEGYSGADLAHLCETAAEFAMEDSMRAGKVRPIQLQDFRAALQDVKSSTRPWLETARDYAMFANESGTYDDLLAYLRSIKMA
jgi:SpoVK/Ycf46/Vps4 family AAA+-type ATPase